MRAPQQTRSTTSTDRMLDATLTLLDVGGLGAVTVAAVAREAGVSNGSLYHRFGDRRGLLVAAQDRAMSLIEQETAAAFARADEEPDDDAAIGLLVGAALDIFGRHHAVMRAFLVEGSGDDAFAERSVRSSHLLAETVTPWLVARTGAPLERADAAYRLLFAIGAGEALFAPEQVSPVPLDRDAFTAAVTRALRAVLG